jgi:hypothetical protein
MPDQWIVGYGSLMDRASRTRQAPRAQSAFPVKVRGVSVGWFHQFKRITQSLSPTFLGAQTVASAICGGVIYKATQTDLNATDERETGYTRVEVPADAISLSTGTGVVLQQGDRYWIYISQEAYVGPPNKTFPLVQSYVDLCVNGALEAAQSYPATAGAFPSEWLGMIDWRPVGQDAGVWWLNDRTYPYRASLTIPNASAIDSTLAGSQGTADLWKTAMRQVVFPA